MISHLCKGMRNGETEPEGGYPKLYIGTASGEVGS